MGSHDNPDRFRSTRRDVLKLTGAGGLFAAATTPSVAEEALDGEFRRVDDVGPDEAIEMSFTPTDWLTVGPFAEQNIGERSNDWLVPLDSSGERGVASGDVEPTGEELLPSAYGAAGRAMWEQVELDEGETTIPLDFFEATDPGFEGDFFGVFGGDPDTFQFWYGLGGVFSTRAYAYASFERDRMGYAVVESDAFEVWVNGIRLDRTPTGVVLQEGTNHVLLKQSEAFGASAELEFRPPRAAVEANSVERVPDLVDGETTDRPAAVRITNTTPDRIDGATVTLEPAEGDLIEPRTVEVDPPLAPFETRIVNTRLTTTRAVDASATAVATTTGDTESIPAEGLTTTAVGERLRNADDPVGVADDSGTLTMDVGTHSETTVVATVEAEGDTDSTSRGITVRGPDENRFVTTYRSAVDESVQLFGFRRPANFESTDGPYELLLNLHGAGVDADSSAGSIAPRDDLYVIGPETRGPVAYDHENVGRLDDLEALSVALDRFDIDEESVYLTGHSMGGHGVLHIGLYHTEKFGGIAPAHGWTEIESYISPAHKRDRMHTHPQLWDARETSLHKSHTQPFTENLLDGNTPMFVLQGGLDTSVPPIMMRHTIRTAASRGLAVEAQGTVRYDGPGPDEVDVAYLEVPGAGHLWDFGIGPGSDHFNHPDMFEFLRDTTLDPYPASLHFYTVNLGIEDSKQWVTVLKQRIANAETRVTAAVDDGAIEVETENVSRLALDLAVLAENGFRGPPTTVTIDGESVRVTPAHVVDDEDLGETPVVFDLRNRPRPASGRNRGRGRVEKTGDLYGPARHVHYEPYRLVYGTGGSAAEREASIELANLRSQALVDRARSPAIVVPDTEVTDEIVERYNLILFGTPGSNTVLERISEDLPIRVDDSAVTVGDRTYEGDLAAHFIYPNPEQTDRFVQVNAGTSVAGLRLNRKYVYTRTFSPSADYAVFDDTFRFQGWNGCLAAGYFDPDWELDAERGFLRQDGYGGPGDGPGRGGRGRGGN